MPLFTSPFYNLRYALRVPRRAAPVFDFSTGTLPANVTFARASVGTHYNSSGSLVTETANTARFDYDPTALTLKGLLVEPAATNFFLQSNNFTTSWTLNGATITANTTTSPDGSQNASTAAVNANAVGVYQKYATAVASGAVFTVSTWLKTNGNPISLGFNGVTNSGDNKGAAFTSTGILARKSYTITASADGSGLYAFPATTSMTTGDGQVMASTVQLYGAQLESGSTMTSYIPTTTGAVTRAADTVTLKWSAFGIPDGVINAQYTFDDNSTQVVSTTISGGTSTVPTNLSRPWINKIQQKTS